MIGKKASEYKTSKKSVQMLVIHSPHSTKDIIGSNKLSKKVKKLSEKKLLSCEVTSRKFVNILNEFSPTLNVRTTYYDVMQSRHT